LLICILFSYILFLCGFIMRIKNHRKFRKYPFIFTWKHKIYFLVFHYHNYDFSKFIGSVLFWSKFTLRKNTTEPNQFDYIIFEKLEYWKFRKKNVPKITMLFLTKPLSTNDLYTQKKKLTHSEIIISSRTAGSTLQKRSLLYKIQTQKKKTVFWIVFLILLIMLNLVKQGYTLYK
jgi:hypothetical protein